METFRSHPGSQTAIFLAGCILSCLLQLVPAQGNLTLGSVPEHPILGQSILLNGNKLREGFVECEWTQPSGNTITIFPDTKFTPTNASQAVQVHRNCSLSIKNLRQSDQGRYTVKVTFPPAKPQEAKGPETFIGFIYLTFCDQKQIRINVKPPNPRVGQNATLIPEGVRLPDNQVSCEWTQKKQFGVEKKFEDSGEVSNKKQNQQQKIRQHGCSLYLTQLTLDDSANYSIYIEVFSDQNSVKEKGTREQMKCYRSQTELQVIQSGSASVKYSAGIIAGALLGSLTWTLVPLLFGVLSPSFPVC